MRKVSSMDEEHIKLIRDSVSKFVQRVAEKFDREGALVLDIAPQVHEGASPYFKKSSVETLDLDKNSGATYIADLTDNNHRLIPDDRFDYVVCTEVLEHTLQPFKAVEEIERLLKSSGIAFVSVPFNFRIHGPLPDCWRFTEHGLRALFNNFEIVELNALETKHRFLMPVHYTLIARKNAS
jgi:SAM-dependent methyltransferase